MTYKKENKRIFILDLMKLLMSIFIVFHHFQQITDVKFKYINFWKGRFNFGYCVEMFFIISGFVCAISREKISNSTFNEFAINKIKRIYPLSILSTLVALIIRLLYYLISGVFLGGIEINIWKILSDLSLSFCWFSEWKLLDINNSLWYLSVLIICYVIFWLVVKKTKKTKESELICDLLIVLVSISSRYLKITLPFVNNNCVRGYASFFTGVILYEIYNRFDLEKIVKISVTNIIFCFLLALLGYSTFFGSSEIDRWASFTFVIFPSVLFILLWINKRLFSNYNCKLNIGEISFNIYVWHLCFILLLQLLNYILSTYGVVIEYNIVSMITTTALTVIFSIFSSKIIEKKINNILKNEK